MLSGGLSSARREDPSQLNDGMGLTFKRPSRDEFSSKGGSYIKLGNHKSNVASPSKRAYDSKFMTHTYDIKDENSGKYTTTINADTGRLYMDMSANVELDNSGGLHTTKFHSGFQRKSEKYISNPAADEVRIKMEESAARGAIMNANRSANIYRTDNKNGFNIITGAPKLGLQPVKEGGGGKRRIEHKISDEVAANSRIMDVDMAEEVTNYAKYNVQVYAASAALAQSNLNMGIVLDLLNFGRK